MHILPTSCYSNESGGVHRRRRTYLFIGVHVCPHCTQRLSIVGSSDLGGPWRSKVQVQWTTGPYVATPLLRITVINTTAHAAKISLYSTVNWTEFALVSPRIDSFESAIVT